VDELNEAGYNASLHLLMLPYGEQADQDDARLACDVIGADDAREFNVKGVTDALADEFGRAYGHEITDYDKGNVKSRARMVAQYATQHECGSLVIGTDHAAEAVVGFYTKYGDGGADILPLTGLTKRQGKQLLQSMGAPERFYTKPPTADLLDGQPGRPDEDELGVTYEQIDDYLEGKVVDEVVAKTIEDRYLVTQHKRNLPVTPNDTWWQ
jgi:NAD+ synthase